MPYCKQTLRKMDYEKFIEHRKEYKTFFQMFSRHKSTKFYTKHSRHPKKWDNKLAYLAGIVDGEGYLKVENHGTIRLIIGMIDKPTIYWIKENFGGNVTLQKTPNGGDFWVWRMNQGKDLFYLLLLLIPFLITKKRKVSPSISFVNRKVQQIGAYIVPYKSNYERWS